MSEQEARETSWIDKTKPILKDMGAWLNTAFRTDLDEIYREPENDEDIRAIEKIRKFNRIEFFSTLLIMFGAMWGPWWMGILQDDSTLELVGYSILGIVGIWALFISPFIHYKIERGYTYRPGYLGLDYEQNGWTAFWEERGFGSLKRHWDENLKDEKMKKVVNFTSLYGVLTIILMLFDDLDYAEDIAGFVGLDSTPLTGYAIQVSMSTIYMGLTLILVVYGTYLAGQWEDTGNKDGIKKALLIVPQTIIAFTSVLVFWGFGIDYQDDGSWTAVWTDQATAFQTAMDNLSNPEQPVGLFLALMVVLVVIIFFLYKYIVSGILIRFDNLKTALFQLVLICTIGIVIIMATWAVMTIPVVDQYIQDHNTSLMGAPSFANALYIFDQRAIEAMNSFSFAGFFANWGYYVYWGLVQELLFLGYWCTLLTKAFKNKFVVALLSSACFGFIHFPSWPLMIFTMAGGFFWAIAWMRKDARNIFIMGAIHGFLGTMVAKLIPITMSVGPSNMA